MKQANEGRLWNIECHEHSDWPNPNCTQATMLERRQNNPTFVELVKMLGFMFDQRQTLFSIFSNKNVGRTWGGKRLINVASNNVRL